MIDVERIKANGPWVLVKIDEPPKQTPGGLWKPEDNFQDRIGTATGLVLSVDPRGWFDKEGKWVPPLVKRGERVMFRGWIQEANRPNPFDKGHSFIHQSDFHGVLEHDT